tara:strand:+ start:142 stop:480 length:339 start_codon:yes stop_codon:yes gene_type:complete
MNYLYFAEAAVETTGEACMYPASAFLGADPVSATTTRLSFKARNNTAVDDNILVAHASGKHLEVAELIASVLEPSPVTRTKFIVVADAEHSVYLDSGNGAGLSGVDEVNTAA